ncbi:unnamed protein product [Mytilus edulis]|uniref:Uncharacterized protein n=1 Tax=Mytilus edulis TaxID=6550 RepID=A0A8S3RIQ2_MYTED|nr:unnamed protein product [Mytilus edulis]
MSALPSLQRDVEKLNAGIQSLTGGYSRCFFIIDYAQLFKPAVHLGRDGLHVIRNEAFILKMTLENYLAERQKCVTFMNATLSSPVQEPDVESLSPKMTYAEVDVDHQNSSRTPSKRKRLCLAGTKRTIKKEYSIKRNEIVLDVTEDVAVILLSSVICTFYQVLFCLLKDLC